MAYEFKKISNVEVVAEPTESANVLIEENGVIKKAPKTAVGGGEIFIINANFEEDMETGEDKVTLDKTFDEIKEAYNEDKLLVIKTPYGFYNCIKMEIYPDGAYDSTFQSVVIEEGTLFCETIKITPIRTIEYYIDLISLSSSEPV